MLAWMLLAAPLTQAFQTERTFHDPPGDALTRRTDFGDDGPFDPLLHHAPELVTIRIGAWAPGDPAADLFRGEFSPSGGFVRFDLVLRGLANPPGRVTDPFNPFEFGPNPVLGFMEIDVDASVWTGGEVDLPMHRYLGAVARFGGLPAEPRFHDRVASCREDFRQPFNQPPYTRRHGEEFHLDLVGEYLREAVISFLVGDDDESFEPGETWRIRAPLFHRAHGFERLSFAKGCGRSGEYDPWDMQTQFAHDLHKGLTTISCVFPLTNEASAAARGERPEENNGNACDQFSVLEGLVDLVESAQYLREHPSGKPEEDIILDWADENPYAALDPDDWTFTVTLGAPYARRDVDGLPIVFTDVFPDPRHGDVNGDGVADELDRLRITQFIREYGRDGRYVIAEFSSDFHLFDTNYDGLVDGFDVANRPRPGDSDGDDDVDLRDAAQFWRCFGASGSLPPPCQQMDFDLNDRIDLRDYRRLAELLRGPGRR